MVIAQVGCFPLKADVIRGGVEASVFGISIELTKTHHVEVFDFPRKNGNGRIEEIEGSIVHRYCNYGKHNKDSKRRIDDVVKDIISVKPDVVHVHGTNDYGAEVYLRLKQYGINTILTVHGLINVEKKNLIKKSPTFKHIYQYIHQSRIEFKLLNSVDRVIVDTNYVKMQIEVLHKKRKIKHLPEIHVIPQGTDDVYYKNESNGWNTILSLGSFSARKGHVLLIKAFDEVCKQVPEARLIIVGTLTEPHYYEQMKAVEGLSLYKNSIKLIPNVQKGELIKLFEKATIFALHSEEESQGIVFSEAMACGLPVVATKVGGIPDVVENGVTGILTKYGDIKSFGEVIVRLLKDNELRKEMGQNGKVAAEKYRWGRIAEEVVKVYECGLS